jgi:predicted AlkP superfamily phosphohydrolase/phosphomutase
MTRTVVLCVSELAPDLVRRWEGMLPELSRLAREGVSGHTRHCAPYLLTPQMWATIVTARNPGRHGVFDYWQRESAGGFHPTDGKSVRAPRFWEAIDADGLRAWIVNVPLTYPPPALRNGTSISGQDAPGAHPSIAQPRREYRRLVTELGRYRLKDIFPGGQDRAEYAAVIPRETDWQSRLFAHLASGRPWDFLMVYASGPAMAQHYFWNDIESCPDGGVVGATYRALDRMVGELRAAAGPDAAFWLMSECGAGPLTSGVNINRWLEGEGFLAFAREERRAAFYREAITRARMLVQRRLPKGLFFLANRPGMRRHLAGRVHDSRIDWSRTVAYHRGKGEGNIYINVRGREPRGIVEPRDRERVAIDVAARLRGLCDPRTGEPAVAAVHRREDLFEGPYTDRAPDLVIEWRDFAYMPNEDGDTSGEVFVDRTREFMSWATSGSHRRDGVLLGAGPGIPAGVDLGPVDLRDLAPTWLASLGCRTAFDCEGKAIPLARDGHAG